MKISVVIPAHNEKDYIEKCLKSLFSQKRKPDEIILVDNASTDETATIASKYNVTIIKEPRKGTVYARNTGFDSAKYDLIVRTDADSVPDKKWLYEIEKFFIKNKDTDAVSGSHFYLGVNDTVNSAMFLQFIALSKMLLNHYPLIGPNMALTKNIWQKIRSELCLNDKIIHEDIDISIHINKVNGKIGLAKKAIVHASMRRLIKNPTSFFIEYPSRLRKMLKDHDVKPVYLNIKKITKIKLPKI